MLCWPGTGDSRFPYKVLKQIAVQYIACSLLMSLVHFLSLAFDYYKSNFNNTLTYTAGITPSSTTTTTDLC
jgi:hypothetical protein